MKFSPGKIFYLVFLALLLIISFLFFGKRVEEITKNSREPEIELTLDQKIGQLFIVSVDGSTFSDETERLIEEIHPGGILLLGRNVRDKEQLKGLIGSLQAASLKDSGLPLFIAVDQEGGLVSRINWAEKTPQSGISNKEEARRIGEERGKNLRELGINLNLAPLADSVLAGDFISERAFQKNAEMSGELAKEIIVGQREAGIFSCLKHFPGYGGIFFNPEDKLATLEKTPEISQFKKAAESLPEMIMVSNVIFQDLNDEMPFSFIREGIALLRKEILGDYLVVSDDLAQYSLLNNFSLEEIVSAPFNAGVDILIFSGWRAPVSEGIEAFKKAVKDKKISLERVDRSVSKIIKLKQNYFKNN